MGRLPSWLIVGAVVVLVAIAAADAIRPSDEAKAPEARGAHRPLDLHGTLVLANHGCAATAIRLPDLVREKPFAPDCDGRRWSSDRTLMALCRRGTTHVFAGRAPVRSVPGCSPAWRPDGALSVIHDGDLVLVRPYGRPQVFFSRARLVRALAGRLEGARTYRLTEVAWNGSVSFVALVAGARPWQRAIVYYTPEGVTGVIPELGQDVSELRVSPLGNIAFARSGAGREYVMVDPSGEEIPLPRIANARAIAWSPDERWVALATRTSTFIGRTGTREVAMRVRLGGEVLEWLP